MSKVCFGILAVLLLPLCLFSAGRKEDEYEQMVLVPKGEGPEESLDAVDYGSPYWDMLLMFADELALSEEQEKAIVRVEADHLDKREGLELQAERMDWEVRMMLREDSSAENVKPLLQNQYALYAELEWEELRKRDRLQALLTEEQREKWKLLERDFSFMSYEKISPEEDFYAEGAF